MIFPSGAEHLHQAQRVTEGSRFVLASWYTLSPDHGEEIPQPAPEDEEEEEEEDDDDGEPELLDVEDEALQTPRPKPLTFSTSNDSTITQVDAEYV